MKEGLKLVAAGMNPMDLKRGVDIAVTAVVKDIERRAKKVQFHEIRFQSRCLIGSRANALALGGSPTQNPIWYGIVGARYKRVLTIDVLAFVIRPDLVQRRMLVRLRVELIRLRRVSGTVAPGARLA